MPRESVEPANQLGYDARRKERSAVNAGRLGGAYQGALEATLAVVISVLLGVWADTKLETSPVFLLVGLVVGFGAFILRLMRLLREVAEPNDDKSDSSDSSDNKHGTSKGSDPATPSHKRDPQPDSDADRDPDL